EFVDAAGARVSVGGAESTVRVEVGSGGPLYPAPSGGPAPIRAPAAVANAPLDLTRDGVVDHADSVLAAVGWAALRARGLVCGAAVDAHLDANHDGCLDVADAQIVASH